jgi:hypothetical protein
MSIIIATAVNRNMYDVTRPDDPKSDAHTLLGSMIRLRKRWAYWPNSSQLQLTASELRALAHKLDKLNKAEGA